MAISTDLILTEDQTQALEELKKFVQGVSDDTFILKGHAGTGKTTLLFVFSNWLREQKYKVVFLSTTGRSAKVLSEKAEVQAKTVHGYLYSLQKVDSPNEKDKDPWSTDSGQLSLFFGLRPRDMGPEQPDLIVVDEASMLSDEKAMDGQAAYFGSGNIMLDLMTQSWPAKLLFVGDPFQLPPITFSDKFLSPALSSETLQKKYNRKVKSFSLKSIVRQASESPIIQLTEALRNQLVNLDPTIPISIPVLNHPDIEYERVPYKFFEKYMTVYNRHGHDETIYLANSAGQTFGANIYMRKIKYPMRNELIHKGEPLLVVQNCQAIGVFNGELIKVINTPSIETHAGVKFYQFNFQSVSSPETFNFRMIAHMPFTKEQSLERETLNRLLKDFDERMRNRRISRNSKEYLDALMNDEYANALRCKFGYASTCHKAQGSEWDHVFVSISSEFLFKYHKEYVLRWLYTAFSRAGKKLYLLDEMLF